jgi:hypothetical protein
MEEEEEEGIDCWLPYYFFVACHVMMTLLLPALSPSRPPNILFALADDDDDDDNNVLLDVGGVARHVVWGNLVESQQKTIRTLSSPRS